MSEIEMREAQLVFVELESQWDDEENRTFALMRELETCRESASSNVHGRVARSWRRPEDDEASLFAFP